MRHLRYSTAEHVYFGCAAGVARHDADAANAEQICSASGAPNDTWRALAFDPTGDGGNGSLWAANFNSVLVEVSLLCAILNSFDNGGWSLNGLAYDATDGNLWGINGGGTVIKIDTGSGEIIPGEGWPCLPPYPVSLSSLRDGSGDLAAVTEGTPNMLVVLPAETVIVPDLNSMTGATGHFGVAVTGGGDGGDCNGNGIPDDCDIMYGPSADCNTNTIPDDCDDDVDGDGVPNEDDVCEFSPLGEPVNPLGGPMGDLDDDCAVTLDDYVFFEVCLWFSGPGGDPGFQDCVDVFDFDGDEDVDLADFAGFQRAFGAP